MRWHTTALATIFVGISACQLVEAQIVLGFPILDKPIEDKSDIIARLIRDELKNNRLTDFYEDSAVMLICGRKELADRLMAAPNNNIADLLSKHVASFDEIQMKTIDPDFIVREVMTWAYGYRQGYVEAFLHIHLESPTGDEDTICEKTAFIAGQLLNAHK